jgi:hypothetical protein
MRYQTALRPGRFPPDSIDIPSIVKAKKLLKGIFDIPMLFWYNFRKNI